MLLLYRPDPRVFVFDSPIKTQNQFGLVYRSLTPQFTVAASASLLLFLSFLAPSLGRPLAYFMVLRRLLMRRTFWMALLMHAILARQRSPGRYAPQL